VKTQRKRRGGKSWLRARLPLGKATELREVGPTCQGLGPKENGRGRLSLSRARLPLGRNILHRVARLVKFGEVRPARAARAGAGLSMAHIGSRARRVSCQK